MKIEQTKSVVSQGIQENNEKIKENHFKFTLNSKIEENNLQTKLNNLMNDITEQGKIIAKTMNIKDLKRYRQYISEFMNEVVAHSHKFKKQHFLSRRGKYGEYSIINVINKNLDDLAQELLEKEKNNIDILNKIDEIKGLLLDIIT